ncbi:MAG: hypothetical protein J5552_01485 [Prevotella sp.]|nr:hypothetical protein [Prevotella sp.]
METARDFVTVNIPRYLIDDMRKEMKNDSADIDKLLETFVYESLHTPKAETRAAIEEARSDVEMGTVDTSNMESFINSILAE